MANELGRDYFPGFSARARKALLGYDWPGNVRELKNVIERCVYRSAPEAEIDDIVFDPFDSPFRPASAVGGWAAGETAQQRAVDWPVDFKDQVQRFETDLIGRALDQARHNQRRAADLLGLTYDQLRGYLKKYNLLKVASGARHRQPRCAGG